MALTSVIILAVQLPLLSYSAFVDMSIVNGTEAKPHSRPYMVSVQKEGKHKCGGFLISKHFVMTAAHCWSKQEDKLTVVVGAHDLSKGKSAGSHIPVKFYHIHPMYNSTTLAGDIMLLQLSIPAEKSDKINWISIPKKDKDVQAKQVCSVAGWGRQTSKGPTSKRLMEVDVSIIDKNTCYKKWRHLGYYVKSMVCAGGKGGFCQGDSGGPLVCKNTAVGIVSYTDEDCTMPMLPNVYTKISSFLPWIKAILSSM